MAAYPLIGVSGSIDAEETRHFILRDYLTAVIAAGGAPVLLSPDMKGDMLEDCLAHLDGLLMAGGNDVSPALFGEPPVEVLGEVNPLRDGFEMRLVRLAAARRMPVLGICRGVQAMAAALGGSLWQDLPSQYRTADGNPPIAHRQTSPGRYASHTVSVLPGTLLARLTDGAETLRVNSFHHQAVKAPGSLRVCALAPDGVIEATEDASLPFFLGVQWHPERMYRSDRAAAALFEGLVRAARGDCRHKKSEPSARSKTAHPGRGRRIRTLNKGFGDPRVTITPCPYGTI